MRIQIMEQILLFHSNALANGNIITVRGQDSHVTTELSGLSVALNESPTTNLPTGGHSHDESPHIRSAARRLHRGAPSVVGAGSGCKG